MSIVGIYRARIDQSALRSTIVVVSSDNPYGIINFDGDSAYNISEDVGYVSLSVVRNKGHIGMLRVTIDVDLSGATEGVDFEVSPKGMMDICVIFLLPY